MLLPLQQDSRLNYIEQHAGRLGLDANKLEGARFSAAKVSPRSTVQSALHKCYLPQLHGQLLADMPLYENGEGLVTHLGLHLLLQASPMGEALDVAASFVDQASLGALLLLQCCSRSLRRTNSSWPCTELDKLLHNASIAWKLWLPMLQRRWCRAWRAS